MFKEHHYQALPECVEVKRSEGKGHGLYAAIDIAAGSYIGISHLALIPDQQKYIKRDYIRTPIGGFINHSEFPNCALVRHPRTEKPTELGIVTHMWAIKPIKKGTELTCFYTDGYEDVIDNFDGPKNLATL